MLTPAGERHRAVLLTLGFVALCGAQALITSSVHAAGPSGAVVMALLLAGLVGGVRLCWVLLLGIELLATLLAALTAVGAEHPYTATVGTAHISASASSVMMLATAACSAAGAAVLLAGPVRRRQSGLRASMHRWTSRDAVS